MHRSNASGPRVAFTHSRPVDGDYLKADSEARSQFAPHLKIIRIAVQQQHRLSRTYAGHAQLPSAFQRFHGGGQPHEMSSCKAWAESTPEMEQKLTHWP